MYFSLSPPPIACCIYNTVLKAINQLSAFEMYMVTRAPTVATNKITSSLICPVEVLHHANGETSDQTAFCARDTV